MPLVFLQGKSKNKKKKPENKKRKGNRPPPKQKQSPPTPKKLLPVLEVSIVEEITVVEEVVTVALVKVRFYAIYVFNRHKTKETAREEVRERKEMLIFPCALFIIK